MGSWEQTAAASLALGAGGCVAECECAWRRAHRGEVRAGAREREPGATRQDGPSVSRRPALRVELWATGRGTHLQEGGGVRLVRRRQRVLELERGSHGSAGQHLRLVHRRRIRQRRVHLRAQRDTQTQASAASTFRASEELLLRAPHALRTLESSCFSAEGATSTTRVAIGARYPSSTFRPGCAGAGTEGRRQLEWAPACAAATSPDLEHAVLLGARVQALGGGVAAPAREAVTKGCQRPAAVACTHVLLCATASIPALP